MLVKIHPEYGSDYMTDIPIELDEDDGTYSIGFAIDEYICENLDGVVSYDIIDEDDEITFSRSE